MDNEVTRLVNPGLLTLLAELTEFVEKKRGMWNHKDWESLRDRVRAKGYSSLSDDAVGLLLEAEKTRFWAGTHLMKEEGTDQVKNLYTVSQKRKYERVRLPQEVIERFNKEHNLIIDGPVDGRLEKEGERWLIRVRRQGWYRIIKDWLIRVRRQGWYRIIKDWLIRVRRKRWYRIIKDRNAFSVSEGEPRTYASTLVPTLTQQAPYAEAERQVLLAIYKEISAAWRALTDVRFKLMGLVPAVSVVAWGQLISHGERAWTLVKRRG